MADSQSIRRLKNEDVDLMLEWMHDENVNSKFCFDFASMTREKAMAFIANSFTDKNQHFAFVDHNNHYLGTISLKNISVKDSNAEYAIVARTLAHGTGVAYKATIEILQYAFYTLNLHRVYLNVLADNLRANNFYRKCGFSYEGQFKEHLFLNGQYKNLNWYAISEEQFAQRNVYFSDII